MSSEVLDELGRLVGDDGAYFVGGCVRDVRLGLPVTDVDVVVRRRPGDRCPAARPRDRRVAVRALRGPRGVARRARRPHPRHHRAARRRYPGRPGPARLHRERDGDPGRRRRRGERRRPVRRPRRPGRGPTARSSRTGSSPTTRSGCCASPGSRTSSGSRSTPTAERLARRDAHLADRPAGERIYAEMRRLMTPDHPDAAVRLLDGLGVLDVILPEAGPMRGCEQSPFHHLDVFEHTLQVLDAAADIAAHPEHYLPRHAESLRARARRRPSATSSTRGTALRLAVLFHDIEKPSTRTVSDDGRIGFMGHDRKGAETAARILKRWRAATVDDPLLRAARRRAPAAGLHGARPAARPPRRLPLPARRPRRTRTRAWWCRSPTGSPRAACARGRRTCAPTPRRPTSCSRSSPSSSPRIASRCFAATRSPS